MIERRFQRSEEALDVPIVPRRVAFGGLMTDAGDGEGDGEQGASTN
jgi:hypothetical protein